MPRLKAPAKDAGAEPKPPPTQPELPDPDPAPESQAGPEKASPAKRGATKPPPGAKTGKTQTSAANDDFGFAELDDTEDFLNLLFYGREGVGKTTAAAKMANAAKAAGHSGRILVVNAEGGLKKRALQRRGVDTSRITIWPAPDSGIEITAKNLERLHERILGDLVDNAASWYGVIFDSITDVHVGLRVQATKKRIDKAMNDAKVVDKSLIDEDFVDRDDYGVMTNQLRDLLRDIRDLPCHVVFTALERVDDKTGVVGPALTPAIATDVLGYTDCNLYLRATQHATGEDDDEAIAEFRALTRPGVKTRAKDRFDLLPRVLAEPDFERVLGYIREDLEEGSDPIQAAYVKRREAEAAAKAAAEAEKAAKRPAAKKAARKTTSKLNETTGSDEQSHNEGEQ